MAVATRERTRPVRTGPDPYSDPDPDRRSGPPGPSEPREIVIRVDGDARRRGRFPWRFAGVVTVVVAVALAVVVVANALGRIDLSILGSRTVDRSAPVALQQVREVATFTAATGEFESLVDVERTVDPLPAFVAGEHVIYVGVGRVDASVDLGDLAPDAVRIDGDGVVHVTVPAPRLEQPVIDPARSRVAIRQRGIVDRIDGALSDNPAGERELALKARRRIARAAAASDLTARAEASTTKMLQGLLGRLGYDRVEVVYTAS